MNLFNRLRQILKIRLDLIDNEKLKRNILNALPYWVGAFITGAVSIFYAKLFGWAEDATHYIFQQANWLFFLITPACFIAAWWLVKKYAPYARGSGIPQVSAAIELTNPKQNYKVGPLLNFKVIFTKIFSSIILVFGGGAIGREGPTIQISAAIFKKINDLLPTWYSKVSKRNMIVTGAAAGLAAAFNTPLGGIVFAIEELTKTHFSFFKSALLTGVIIAGLTALYFLGPYLYLGYPDLAGVTAWLIVIIVPLAVVTGMAGNGMGKLIIYIINKKKSFTKNHHQVVYLVLCGLILAALAIFIDYRTFGSGKEIMVTTLFTEDKHAEWYVPILRFFGPVLSFTSGAAGGIFAPSLSAGASIGAVVAEWFELTNPETNLVILCGMTGFLTGITKAPFTSSILVLEMTNSHDVIFYILVTALASNLVATVVSRRSFYDHLKDQYIDEVHKSAELQQPAK